MRRPQTIEEVVIALTEIVDTSIAQESRIGYFAALYRKVTIDIREKIAAGVFDDGARMERFDVVFANRYLDAAHAYRSGAPTSTCWAFAFDVSQHWSPLVLQHLLLGMNAHINLDLGVAAAEVAPGAALPALKPDFDRINGVLAELVDDVQAELAEIWTTLRWFNRYLGDVETALINFSMEKARDHAWSVAERLAPLQGPAHADVVADVDRSVTTLGRAIRYPGPVLRIATGLVRIGERGSVSRKTQILE